MSTPHGETLETIFPTDRQYCYERDGKSNSNATQRREIHKHSMDGRGRTMSQQLIGVYRGQGFPHFTLDPLDIPFPAVLRKSNSMSK